MNPKHLRLGTNAENVRDAVDRGKRGKLSVADVHAIRAAVAEGRTQKDVAAEFGVSQMTVSHVARKRSWAFV